MAIFDAPHSLALVKDQFCTNLKTLEQAQSFFANYSQALGPSVLADTPSAAYVLLTCSLVGLMHR